LALPNALNLLFGKGLLTGATLSQSLDRDLLEPFGALDGDALRLVSPLSVLKINMCLNGMVLKHSICTFYKKCPKIVRGLNGDRVCIKNVPSGL
jgi:hypothetical protein